MSLIAMGLFLGSEEELRQYAEMLSKQIIESYESALEGSVAASVILRDRYKDDPAALARIDNHTAIFAEWLIGKIEKERADLSKKLLYVGVGRVHLGGGK